MFIPQFLKISYSRPSQEVECDVEYTVEGLSFQNYIISIISIIFFVFFVFFERVVRLYDRQRVSPIFVMLYFFLEITNSIKASFVSDLP